MTREERGRETAAFFRKMADDIESGKLVVEVMNIQREHEEFSKGRRSFSVFTGYEEIEIRTFDKEARIRSFQNMKHS